MFGYHARSNQVGLSTDPRWASFAVLGGPVGGRFVRADADERNPDLERYAGAIIGLHLDLAESGDSL